MLDPKRLLEKIPRLDRDRPFRYLGRRVVQTMAEAATSNLVIGQRSAPGRYLVVRLVADAGEKDAWEQQFAESRTAILKELEREAAVREIKLRSALELDLFVLTDAEAARGEAERILGTVVEPDDVPEQYARLQEEREIILPRRVRTLILESDPPEAQAYLNDRAVGVTPCRVDDVPEGDHTVAFSRPGYLLYEGQLRIEPGRPGQKITHRAVLEPEPQMGALEVRTFPPGARVVIGEESRDSPARWRLPVGPVEIRVELEDFRTEVIRTEVPPVPENRPHRVQVRLEYTGPAREEIVGRLVVYKPGTYTAPKGQQPPPNPISAFFRDVDPEARDDAWGGDAWSESRREAAAPGEPVVLGERPLRRGVLLIGREDPGDLMPDIRLFDPENTVSRGCHAWLWVYADRSTGATYNTFLVGNNSPAGIRVDGQLVMESRRLADDSVIEIGNFAMRLVKETPEPRVEFGF